MHEIRNPTIRAKLGLIPVEKHKPLFKLKENVKFVNWS